MSLEVEYVTTSNVMRLQLRHDYLKLDFLDSRHFFLEIISDFGIKL